MDKQLTHTSKFLSLILRHKPETIGLQLDAQGWADVEQLRTLAATHGKPITMDLLLRVVAENDKKRFVFNADESRIRANQGHSIEIDLALEPIEPPTELFHGTATRFIESIREHGLIRGQRQHVHLSLDSETATKVGHRHGEPVVLVVAATRLFESGGVFFRSENGVWLTNEVPVEYIVFPD